MVLLEALRAEDEQGEGKAHDCDAARHALRRKRGHAHHTLPSRLYEKQRRFFCLVNV